MRQTIVDTFEFDKLRSGLSAGVATVGRPTGVAGKNRTPRRAKMTSKEVDHIKTKAGIKAGGPGSGRHSEGLTHYTQKIGPKTFTIPKEEMEQTTHPKTGEKVLYRKSSDRYYQHDGKGNVTPIEKEIKDPFAKFDKK